MKYLVLVSHGEFAAGLKTSLMMLAGQRDDVIASGLPDGKTADEFAEIFKESVKDIHEDDENTFQLVDSTRLPKPAYQKRTRFQQNERARPAAHQRPTRQLLSA